MLTAEKIKLRLEIAIVSREDPWLLPAPSATLLLATVAAG
jgi:hypothetical protein